MTELIDQEYSSLVTVEPQCYLTRQGGFIPQCWLMAFLILCSLKGSAQLHSANEKLAVVYPVGNLHVAKAKVGVKLFSDRNYRLQGVPVSLSGTSFIVGSMTEGSLFIPVTTGILYMVTPLRGQPNSQEEFLVSEGFQKLDQPSFSLFKGQTEEIGIFQKKIDTKFRRIPVTGWAIPFFASGVLPSITTAATVSWSPGPDYAINTRLWQGCPTIEKTGKRLWTAWFSGGPKEPAKGNYGIVSYSDDDGKTWIDPAMIIVHPDSTVRVMDTQIWKDPQDRLWIFWTQNTGNNGFDGIWGTWAIRIDDPTAEKPIWTAPRRLCDGLTRNKPTVLSNGEWLLPSYNWINNQSTVYASTDKGQHWTLRGGPLNDIAYFYEHMLVELKDGRVWMLQRRMKDSYSSNAGKDWTPLAPNQNFPGVDSRLYLRRLKSGNLLLVYNHDPDQKARKNLTAVLSEDDGKTWPYKLLLDERTNISYPDAIQAENGLIYLTYDRSRTGEKEILLTTFTEDDVKAGRYGSAQAQQKRIISKVQ